MMSRYFLRRISFLRAADVCLSALLVLFGSTSMAAISLTKQGEPIRCGVEDLSMQQLQRLRVQIGHWLDAGGQVLSTATTIPVAFHVVRYDNGNANVTDQEIEDQIEVLNAAYANTNFQFNLHSIDRTDSSEWSDHRMGSSQEAQMKQTLAIDPAHVLNFYTCGAPRRPNGDLVLGYATFPWMYSEDSQMHGVVVLYSTLPGGSEPNYNEGDTGTHEVGHYVGLYHTFQNGCDEPGDEVDDTPYEQSPAFDCPSGRNTCPDPEPDPIHNFMDYTYDSCMDHFTDGQSDRMDTLMAQNRPSMFIVQVAVDQLRADGTRLSGTTVGRWNGSLFTELQITSTPDTIGASVGTREVLRSYQQLVTNPTEKYRVWERNQVEQLDTVQNHRGFTISLDVENLTSRFHHTHETITVRNEFLSAPGADPEDDFVEFKDPWLIDYNDPPYGTRNQGMAAPFKTYPSPLNITLASEFKGVFLNQPYDDPPNPYYSVSAPQTQTIPFHGENIEWYFQKWSGTNVQFEHSNQSETGVVFQQPNAEARAEYKGHLASNTTHATSSNNQRKMVFDGSDYHMVYEDNGEIYYTTSDDDGETWSNEIRISNVGGTNKYPSIADYISEEDNYILAVWQNDGRIFLRCKTPSGWSSTHEVSILSTDPDATPVAAYSQWWFFIVWPGEETFENRLNIRRYDPRTGTLVGTIEGIDETSSDSRNPTLECDGHQELHLAWEEEGKIYYSKFSYDDRYDDYRWDLSRECVSDGTGYSDHVSPSITTDYDARPSVMWEAYSGPALETRIILHRRRKMSWPDPGWGTTTMFGHADGYFKPSISGFPNVQSNQELRAVWTRSENMVWAARYNSEEWEDTWVWWNYGKDPNLSSNMSTVEAAKMVYRSTGVLPYILTTTSEELMESQVLSTKSSSKYIRHRRGVVSLGKSEIAFELGEFEMNGNSVNLFRYPDTLIVGKTVGWQEVFRTEPFLASRTVNLNYFRGFEVINRDSLEIIFPSQAKIEFKLEVVDASTEKVLATPAIQSVTKNIPPDLRKFENVVFNLPGNRQVYLRVALAISGQIQPKLSMVEAYYEKETIGFDKSMAENTPVEITIPTQFELLQNYPNPFNPETRIEFALPEEQNVRLEVYDISGRRIRTLVDQKMSAGLHQVNWNGENDYGNQVGSGVYIYRMNAGTYESSKKMMLLR